MREWVNGRYLFCLFTSLLGHRGPVSTPFSMPPYLIQLGIFRKPEPRRNCRCSSSPGAISSFFLLLLFASLPRLFLQKFSHPQPPP
ncbi:UNVERIFIED_CONTAM: hypothetical protein Slati_3975500 [Sesamum latifolium]|uniref:Uncharacterized protein n=1 Tax=Sesamum latifolium TaxID=2727402 RepID=A0AAW2TSR8_9LAMI